MRSPSEPTFLLLKRGQAVKERTIASRDFIGLRTAQRYLGSDKISESTSVNSSDKEEGREKEREKERDRTKGPSRRRELAGQAVTNNLREAPSCTIINFPDR